jgi:hypothetical protein
MTASRNALVATVGLPGHEGMTRRKPMLPTL